MKRIKMEIQSSIPNELAIKIIRNGADAFNFKMIKALNETSNLNHYVLESIEYCFLTGIYHNLLKENNINENDIEFILLYGYLLIVKKLSKNHATKKIKYIRSMRNSYIGNMAFEYGLNYKNIENSFGEFININIDTLESIQNEIEIRSKKSKLYLLIISIIITFIGFIFYFLVLQ